KRLRFAFGDQIVHDQIGSALKTPTIFVLAPTVLQVQHGIASFEILIVPGWSIDERTASGVGAWRVKEDLSQLSVRDVLHGIEVLVVRRDFHATSPAIGTEEKHAVWVGNLGAIDIDGVVVEAFVQRPCVADPGAVLILGEGAAASEAHRDTL